MEVQTAILLGAVACLALALLARWVEAIDAACRRSVPLVLAPEIEEASEALRQLAAEAERVTSRLPKGQPFIDPVKERAGDKVLRRAGLAPDPMKDERFRGPAKKKAAKRA